MIRYFLVAQITSLPHSALRGMTNDDISSKWNKVLFDDVERFWGEFKFRELALLSTGERRDELEFREVGSGSVGVDGAGELEDENELLPAAPPVPDTAISPSGTW